MFKFIQFDGKKDNRGTLVSLEANKTIPFEIKRVYYLTDLNFSEPRGFHAHRDLKQVAICIKGECDFLLDDGLNKTTVHLDNPTTGILIEGLIWREMHSFSKECVILVFASEYYDEGDYIRDYNEFLLEVKGEV